MTRKQNGPHLVEPDYMALSTHPFSVSRDDPRFLAYMAGLFDGEGSININTVSRPATRWGESLQLSTTLHIREGWLLEMIHGVWGGSLRKNGRTNPKWAATWRWRLSDRGAAVFLSDIAPYLFLKQGLALLAIQFRSIKEIPRNQKTDADHADARSVRDTLMVLNRKGVDRWTQQTG